MAATLAVPAEAMRGRHSFGDDQLDADRGARDRGPAQGVIEDSEAAWDWTRVTLMLGAARVRRERLHRADTWTFITVAFFLLWTVAVLLGA